MGGQGIQSGDFSIIFHLGEIFGGSIAAVITASALLAASDGSNPKMSVAIVRHDMPRKYWSIVATDSLTNRLNNPIRVMRANDQLTDGGPPLAFESPRRSAGPTFGEAPSSAAAIRMSDMGQVWPVPAQLSARSR